MSEIAPLRVDVSLATPRGDGAMDVATRPDAAKPLAIGGELPFADASVGALRIGDAIASLSVRDRMQLMLECRRVLAPGAPLTLVEPAAIETRDAIARWAALA